MKENKTDCDKNRVDQFLANQMSEQEQREFESHIESCDPCRQSLDEAAAETSWWSEAQEHLGDQRTKVDLSETLSFLNPSDDPRMMGRFGGYEIAGLIGQGGMGIVLKGFDQSLNRFAAIKVLAPQLVTGGSARNRFAREAQAAAAVVHDNVIGIHGVSEAAGLPYLVMPYVRGESLQKRLDREGPLNPTEIVRIVHQIASGLAAAHAQGLVHRDIKPANILLPEGVERVLITDFGLARTVNESNLTGTGIIAGTPEFMSPEQARGDNVDTRSDLFSLGTVMYAMCTGRSPFRSTNPFGILRRIVEDQPKPVRQINPSIPAWLETIVSRLHEKAPEDRLHDASELAHLLEKCLAHLQNPSVRLPEELKPATRSSVWKWVAAATFIGFLVCSAFLYPRNMKSPFEKQESSKTPPSQVVEQKSDPETAFETQDLAEEPIAKGEGGAEAVDAEQSIVRLQQARKKVLEAWAAVEAVKANGNSALRARADTLKVQYLQADRRYREALAIESYQNEMAKSFDESRNSTDTNMLMEARKASRDKLQSLKSRYDEGQDIDVKSIKMAQQQFHYFEEQIAFRALQSDLFETRAKAEKFFESEPEQTLNLLTGFQDRIARSNIDGSRKEPLLKIVERDIEEIKTRLNLDKPKSKSRERLDRLSSQIAQLRREGAWSDALMVEKELITELMVNDPDHEILDHLREKMIEYRLNGEHNKADEVTMEMNRRKMKLANRYSELQRISEFEKRRAKQVGVIESRMRSLLEAGEIEEVGMLEKEIEDVERKLAHEFARESLNTSLTSKNELQNATTQVHKATQNLAIAEQAFAHSQKLNAKGFITPEQLAADKLAVEIAMLKLQSAKNRLQLITGSEPISPDEQ